MSNKPKSGQELNKNTGLTELKVIDVVNNYLQALYYSDEPILRKVFHPNVIMWGMRNGQLESATLDEFVLKLAGLPVPADIGEIYDMSIQSIDIDGPLAVVRAVDLHLGEWYTDYLSLMEINGSWLIIAKTYYAHS